MPIEIQTQRKSLAPLRSRSRTAQIAERLWEHIVDNALNTGAVLPSESDLAAQLDVSRPAVREAVKQLEVLDLVESRHGVGLRVGRMRVSTVLGRVLRWLTATPVGLLHAFKLRMLLEVGALAETFDRITPEQIATLEQAARRMKTATNVQEYLTPDREFHSVLVANSQLQADLLALIDGYFNTRIRFQGTPYESRWAELAEEHMAIAEAIKRRDKPAALEALEHTFQKHIPGWEEFVRTKAKGSREPAEPHDG